MKLNHYENRLLIKANTSLSMSTRDQIVCRIIQTHPLSKTPFQKMFIKIVGSVSLTCVVIGSCVESKNCTTTRKTGEQGVRTYTFRKSCTYQFTVSS